MSDTATTLEARDWRRRVRESRLGTVAVLAVTAAVVLAGVWFVQGGSESPGAAGVTAVDVEGVDGSAALVAGARAPSFRAVGVDGSAVSLAALAGQPVWLTFGASWCSSCQAEAPDIQAAYERHKADGAVVVEVFIDEDAGTVRDYVQRIGLTYPTVADEASVLAEQYRILGIPAHFFIDGDGVIRSVRTGSMSPAEMDAELAGLAG